MPINFRCSWWGVGHCDSDSCHRSPGGLSSSTFMYHEEQKETNNKEVHQISFKWADTFLATRARSSVSNTVSINFAEYPLCSYIQTQACQTDIRIFPILNLNIFNGKFMSLHQTTVWSLSTPFELLYYLENQISVGVWRSHGSQLLEKPLLQACFTDEKFHTSHTVILIGRSNKRIFSTEESTFFCNAHLCSELKLNWFSITPSMVVN